MTHDVPTFDPDQQRVRRTLVVIAPGVSFTRELPSAGEIVIGRALECDVRIDDPAISRRHAVLAVGPTLTLTVESKTGKTRLDGQELAPDTPHAIEAGQILELGKARVVIRWDRAAAPSSGTRPIDAADRSADLASKSDLPALLVGETGAGKEVMFERIVAASKRAQKPIVRINCAALPVTGAALEGELFGGDRGGVFESANEGTVFLDEVADLPLGVQAKLLRVIEGREVTRLGSATPSRIDVRVVAATNRDLRKRVAEGTFREDLYFRLAGVVITVPPLRERADEIEAIALTLLKEEAARAGRAAPALSEATRSLLVSYRWPGNVRELRNVLARAVHTGGATIEPEHVELLPPAPPVSSPPHDDAAPRSSAKDSEPPGPLDDSPPTDDEKSRIVDALKRANGNQKEAARLLGMSRRQLMYRLDTYNLPRPRKR